MASLRALREYAPFEEAAVRADQRTKAGWLVQQEQDERVGPDGWFVWPEEDWQHEVDSMVISLVPHVVGEKILTPYRVWDQRSALQKDLVALSTITMTALGFRPVLAAYYYGGSTTLAACLEHFKARVLPKLQGKFYVLAPIGWPSQLILNDVFLIPDQELREVWDLCNGVASAIGLPPFDVVGSKCFFRLATEKQYMEMPGICGLLNIPGSRSINGLYLDLDNARQTVYQDAQLLEHLQDAAWLWGKCRVEKRWERASWEETVRLSETARGFTVNDMKITWLNAGNANQVEALVLNSFEKCLLLTYFPHGEPTEMLWALFRSRAEVLTIFGETTWEATAAKTYDFVAKMQGWCNRGNFLLKSASAVKVLVTMLMCTMLSKGGGVRTLPLLQNFVRGLVGEVRLSLFAFSETERYGTFRVVSLANGAAGARELDGADVGIVAWPARRQELKERAIGQLRSLVHTLLGLGFTLRDIAQMRLDLMLSLDKDMQELGLHGVELTETNAALGAVGNAQTLAWNMRMCLNAQTLAHVVASKTGRAWEPAARFLNLAYLDGADPRDLMMEEGLDCFTL